MKIIFLFICCIVLISCGSRRNPAPPPVARVNYQWLDSIKKSADTIFEKKYGTLKFAKAVYYVNSSKAITCQLMKDSSDTIRQIIVTQNNKRNFFATYYANGQLMAELPLNSYGQYQGPSKYYYENGYVESEGEYQDGLKTGTWKNFDQNGNLVSKSKYNSNGQGTEEIIRK
jgi:antitoxin component YwqK of YwqJK toxin-antitoxin module